MKVKSIIQIILSLAGLAWFAYYLLALWWNAGYHPLLLIGTLTGLPIGALLYWAIKSRDRRLLAAGQNAGQPLVWMFVLIGTIVFLVPLFNMLSEAMFLAWATAALSGAFAWWFFIAWLGIAKGSDSARQSK